MREGHDPRPIRIIDTVSNDAAAVVTMEAETDQYHSIRWIGGGYSAAPAALSLLTVVFGSTTTYQTYILTNVPFHFEFDPGNATKTLNEACVVTLSDPAGSIVSKLTVGYQ